jgi:glyoxylase-like metal-dependent hydrolase (beta-lactamase superfamily II)
MAQSGTHRWTVGAIQVTRVADPGFELVLPQDEATAAILKATPWLCPDFVTDEQSLRIGSSAVAVRTPSATIVIDPFLAFDDPARLAPRLAALRAAGIDPDDVDIVLNTHIDGAGANVLADGAPAFANARYLIPTAELDDARAGLHGDAGQALAALQEDGRVDPVVGGELLTPGVRIEDTPGHSHGHVAAWVESGGTTAVVTGHLFLHPAQIANPEVENGDVDPITLARTRRSLLARCVREDAVLIGPLFAPPGGGKVRQDGATWRLMLP